MWESSRNYRWHAGKHTQDHNTPKGSLCFRLPASELAMHWPMTLV